MRPLVLLALLLGACGGGDGGGQNNPPSGSPASADIRLLFMGNSHTSSNDLTGMVAEMVRAARPGKTVASAEAPGWMFLDERSNDAASLNLLRSQNWTVVVLQAQKYSSSGQFTYSTAEAEELIRLARQQQAVPVMFPEWPRRDVAETQRIYDLHVSIAQEEAACVAPVGQAWDLALSRHPSLALHAADGNHSNAAGAFLAALILFATITGESPAGVPDLPQFGVDGGSQALLRAVAAETVRGWPPRGLCPSDPVA
jgi:hypothetical protein